MRNTNPLVAADRITVQKVANGYMIYSAVSDMAKETIVAESFPNMIVRLAEVFEYDLQPPAAKPTMEVK